MTRSDVGPMNRDASARLDKPAPVMQCSRWASAELALSLKYLTSLNTFMPDTDKMASLY